MHPNPPERDELFESFARALFKHDMDALYRVVSPRFVWRYHDGVSPEVVLVGPTRSSSTSTRRRLFMRYAASMTSSIITCLTSPS